MITLESRFCRFVAWELSMPRTGWTPSIVPNSDDQNVYIVLTILAARVAPIAKRMSSGQILRRSSWTCSRGSTKTQSA
jgi:hypothetical protein